MQDLSTRSIATSGESVSTYPHRPKAEAFINAADVVVRLHDPADPSTEHTAPPRSTHVRCNDVSSFLIQQGEGEVDGVVLVVIQITDYPSAERTAPPRSTHVQLDDVSLGLSWI